MTRVATVLGFGLFVAIIIVVALTGVADEDSRTPADEAEEPAFQE